MRLLLKAKYIILSVLFLIALVVGTKYGWLVQRYTFSKTLQTDLVPTVNVVNNLNRCLRTCDAKDKVFAEHFLALILEVENGEKTFAQQLQNMRSIVNQAIQKYTDENAIRSAVEMFSAALALNEEFIRDSDFQQELFLGIEKLVSRNPRNGHVYFARGLALNQKNPRDEKAVEAFRKCLLILPTESQCRDGYAKAVSAFTAARCGSEGVEPSVSFQVSPVAVAEGTAPLIVELSREDIKEVSQEENLNGDDQLYFAWKDEALQKLPLKQESGKGQKQELILNIFKNGESLATAQISKKTEQTKWFIDSSSDTLFSELCAQPIHPELSKRLRL